MDLKIFMLSKFVALFLLFTMFLNEKFDFFNNQYFSIMGLSLTLILILIEYLDRITLIKKIEIVEKNLDSIDKEGYQNKLRNTNNSEFLEICRRVNKMVTIIQKLKNENSSLKDDISKWNDHLEKKVLKKAEQLNQVKIENRELQGQNSELNEKTKIDGLTKLFNHEYAYDKLAEEIIIAKRQKLALTVILFDIDHFKNINDTHGHQVGDEVLVQVSEALKNATRELDIVARYGGEEFLAILPETAKQGALILANRIREEIADIVFDIDGLKVTISGGLAEWNDEGALKLVNRADELLYTAKHNGRNRIEND